jgi:tRNA (cmo5U34)-methyltransferase
MNRFDKSARTWDNNPIHQQRSEAIASRLRHLIHPNRKMTALEFGAGTGILSFLLRDSLKEIVMMDNSSAMVKVMKEKIRSINAENLKPVCFNLFESDAYDKTFDLIYTQMVLHHIENIPSLFSKFYQMLNPSGNLAIADLYPEDGSFHGEGFSGHKGFDANELCNQLHDFGFKNPQHELCFVVKKRVATGEEKEFPIFILTATK